MRSTISFAVDRGKQGGSTNGDRADASRGREAGRRTWGAQVRARVGAVEGARGAQGDFAVRLLPAGDFEVCGGGKGPHGCEEDDGADWTGGGWERISTQSRRRPESEMSAERD